MPAGLDLFMLAYGLGALLLLWAALMARRSRFDALLLGLAGMLLLLRPALRQLGVTDTSFSFLPELALALIGLILLVRVFLSRLSGLERAGLGAVGCLLLIPAMIVAGVIALFAMGSGHDARIANHAANEAAANQAAANQAEPLLNAGAGP